MSSDARVGWDRLRWALLLGWLAVAVAVPLTCSRSASWADVQQLVGRGDVSDVRVSGELPAGATGMTHVQIRWRHFGLNYVTEVIQVRGGGHPGAVGDARSDGYDARSITPSVDLLTLQPGLHVTRDGRVEHLGDTSLGFYQPGWLGLTIIGLWLLGLLLLIRGPEPWRATRWAWFWFITQPVGVVAFLLLSGPTRPIPWPRHPDRRITGGWAIVLKFVAGAITFNLPL